MQSNWIAVLVIPICVIATIFLNISLLIGDNNHFSRERHDGSFDAPALQDIKKNTTLSEQDPSVEARIKNDVISGKQMDDKYSNLPFEKLSSVDSFTCCGLGHRLTRLVNAAL